MTKKDYQPPIVWARFQNWLSQQPEKIKNDRHPQLFIYLKEEEGAFYLNGPKLYWDDKVGDGYFGNCEQDALYEKRDQLAEVMAITRGEQHSLGMFADFMGTHAPVESSSSRGPSKTLRIDERVKDRAMKLYPELGDRGAVEHCADKFALLMLRAERSLAGIFTKNELMAMIDRANGMMLTEQFQGLKDVFKFGLEEAEKWEGTLSKWNVDQDVLFEKLKHLSNLDIWLLEELIDIQWNQQMGRNIDGFAEKLAADE